MTGVEPLTCGDAVPGTEQNQLSVWSSPRRGPFLPYSGGTRTPAGQCANLIDPTLAPL
jgi:hypothetical protein